ncbi:hypothetical protein H4R99_000590 [Coemansia sp. RSA 1722]|nr:hypothetical protein LPJ57_000280 [Coemansia sp. RSA 486]KAJ2238047.1 hypothetical protein IWW45_000387 [Coemansia sp. RSA 485]KAJ2603594.1 hypothetical protein GGF39_000087 [Coemansia sp. RSA 1721]KAJ2606195.1 hypothetical protein H4R99_000590 [Coemansia sp. RSA 1722]KAJ2639681.1 hypothetical protein GGF40_000647 [Coemansia sp. RSA 1286]
MLARLSLTSLCVAALLSLEAVNALIKPACDSPIYCYGDILHAVQMARLFADDKTFVDKPTKAPVDQVLANFNSIGGINATRDDLLAFVQNNFGAEGQELRQVDDLPELNPDPEFIDRVHDPLLRAFGRTVNGYWKTLIREQDLNHLCQGCVSSMLPLKYHFVVPGGRFREIYYWDTYFTLEGLLRSGLVSVAKSNIRDLLDFVDMYGFVPNGARVYYLDRSQPPMLTLMVKLYYEHTQDEDFLKEAIPRLIREHKYWIDNHSVAVDTADGVKHMLNRYIVNTDQPRPESYSADYLLAHNTSSDPARQAAVYADIAAGAESGWDYTVRWVSDPSASPDRVLQGIRTSHVVPVELNAILYQVERTLAEYAEKIGNSTDHARSYRDMAATRRAAMKKVFYDADSGLYFDYILDNGGRRSDIFSPAALWPYWSFASNGTATEASTDAGAQRAFSYVSKVLLQSPGGIPATLINSGQQWDFPQAWPPLQYVIMQGALATGNSAMASAVAQSYVNSVFCAWYNTGGYIPEVLAQLPGLNDTGHIFEKFNSQLVGKQGTGGEYTVQAGFGWTNGVLLWSLDKFGDALSTPVCPGTIIQTVDAPKDGAATSSAPCSATAAH